ncbi:sulfotransferase 1B1-like isoform X2 [Dermacentor albipictus]|uniref:sulfotransferase 1B1-like isoform X2 n=1 Tax=Dermacentor albipictus TaxID=60249 RepID=UPI0031FCC06B
MENSSEPEYESPPGSDPGSDSEGYNANITAATIAGPGYAGPISAEPNDQLVPVGADQRNQNEDSSVSDPGPPSEVDALNARNFLVEETLLSALTYQPRPSDVFTVSYPKCGSALLNFLVFGILNRGQPSNDFAEFVSRSPYLEWMGIKSVLEMRRPGTIKTHLPFDKQPYSPQAKYERRHDQNVLFITYEDVKSDPGAWTIRIADFIDQLFARELRDDPALLSNVLKIASANSMTTTCNQGMRSILADELAMAVGREPITPAEFYKSIFAEALEITEGSDFTRKPICGRWKELFKPEQVQRMKEWIAQKTAGSDVLSIWSNSELP